MTHQVGDRLQVGLELAERGATAGWIGTVTALVGGAQGPADYVVTRPYGESREIGEALVPEEQIVAGPLAPVSSFAIGQAVRIMGAGVGTIVDIEDGLATVEIWVELGRRRVRRVLGEAGYIRTHITSLWRLAMEN
jgi:hypothetical protein